MVRHLLRRQDVRFLTACGTSRVGITCRQQEHVLDLLPGAAEQVRRTGLRRREIHAAHRPRDVQQGFPAPVNAPVVGNVYGVLTLGVFADANGLASLLQVDRYLGGGDGCFIGRLIPQAVPGHDPGPIAGRRQNVRVPRYDAVCVAGHGRPGAPCAGGRGPIAHQGAGVGPAQGGKGHLAPGADVCPLVRRKARPV